MTISSHKYINIKLAADMIPTFDDKIPAILSFIRACKSVVQYEIRVSEILRKPLMQSKRDFLKKLSLG